MRIRAAISASALAVSIVLGGAGAALAKDKTDHHSSSGAGKYGACGISAGIIDHVGPVYSEGCMGGGYAWSWKS